jgi:hypothetical protein
MVFHATEQFFRPGNGPEEAETPLDDLPRVLPALDPGALPELRKSWTLRNLLLFIVPVFVLALGAMWLSGDRGLLLSSGNKVEKEGPGGSREAIVSIQDNTHAFFMENKTAGQFFVVEGEVTNQSPEATSFVLLEGKLYNKKNEVAQSQRCYCGNVMTREELVHLNIAEIQNHMMNREGKKLTNVHIPPQNRVPFMLVFHNLPEMDNLTDYSVEVISAEMD